MVDNKKSLYCPGCGTKMHKVFIKSANIYLDMCLDGCGGIWFDNSEEKFFDEQHENIDEILTALEGKKFKFVNQNANRICPLCGAVMRKAPTSVKRVVEIDECAACGGKFFDYGELRGMRSEYATEEERSSDALNYAKEKFSYLNEYSAVDTSNMTFIDKFLYSKFFADLMSIIKK